MGWFNKTTDGERLTTRAEHSRDSIYAMEKAQGYHRYERERQERFMWDTYRFLKESFSGCIDAVIDDPVRAEEACFQMMSCARFHGMGLPGWAKHGEAVVKMKEWFLENGYELKEEAGNE